MKKYLLIVLYVLPSVYTNTYGQQNVFASTKLKAKIENDILNRYSISTEKTKAKDDDNFINHNSISTRHPMTMPPPRSISTNDKIFIDFIGSGDIQKSMSEGKEINANTGIGIIFERTKWIKNDDLMIMHEIIQSFELEGTINIATTADTIISKMNNNVLQNRRNFGTYVLNPISSKQSLYINSNIYFGYPIKKDLEKTFFAKIASVVSGVNMRVISSNNIWRYNESDTNLGVLAIRAGVFHEFIPDNYRLSKEEGRSKYSLFLGMNYTYRGVFGDISSSKNDELRTNILGTSKTQFQGFEMNFGFRLNNLRAEFQMPMLKNNDETIDGLTNTQFLFSIKFIGGFALKLKE